MTLVLEVPQMIPTSAQRTTVDQDQALFHLLVQLLTLVTWFQAGLGLINQILNNCFLVRYWIKLRKPFYSLILKLTIFRTFHLFVSDWSSLKLDNQRQHFAELELAQCSINEKSWFLVTFNFFHGMTCPSLFVNDAENQFYLILHFFRM